MRTFTDGDDPAHRRVRDPHSPIVIRGERERGGRQASDKLGEDIARRRSRTPSRKLSAAAVWGGHARNAST